MQKKTFTRWVNNQLIPTGHTITNLYEDFRTGVNLIYMLQVLFKEEITP